MKVTYYNFGAIGTNCYIVWDEKTKDAFCVDIADGATDEYFEFITANKLNVKYMLITHSHADHTSSARIFKSRFPLAKFVISALDYKNMKRFSAPFADTVNFVIPDILVNGRDELDFGDKKIKVLATAGHTSGGVCYFIDNMLFCGDTVFHLSVGRTDLPTGSFDDMFKSIDKIKKLPECKIFPGHGETTTLSAEKADNPYFNYDTDN